jgi:rod shape determining protein RodA
MNSFFNFKNIYKLITSLDLIIIFCVISFFILSLFTLFNGQNASNAFFDRQLIWATISIITIILLSFLDFSFIKKTKYIVSIYILSFFGLASTLVFGKYISGSRAWIDFGFFSVQPADFAKIAIITLLARYFAKRHLEIGNIRHILTSLFYVFIFVFIVLLQPDLGSALVLLAIWFGVLFFSGISKRHLLLFLITGICMSLFFWSFIFKDYQKNRILNFLDPARDRVASGYNVYQSQIAVGSGMIFGKGLTQGSQSTFDYLPENETDFIFASFAEEWGFVGAFTFFCIFVTFIFRLMYLSYFARDNFISFIIMGFVFWIMTHFIVNIGMNIGLLPVTGIPLPFVSYGGSHLLSEAIMLGIILSFVKRSGLNPKRYYKNEFFGLG